MSSQRSVTDNGGPQACCPQSTNQRGDVAANLHGPPMFEPPASLCMPAVHLGHHGEGHPEAGDGGGGQNTAHPQRPTPVEGHWCVKIHCNFRCNSLYTKPLQMLSLWS